MTFITLNCTSGARLLIPADRIALVERCGGGVFVVDMDDNNLFASDDYGDVARSIVGVDGAWAEFDNADGNEVLVRRTAVRQVAEDEGVARMTVANVNFNLAQPFDSVVLTLSNPTFAEMPEGVQPV